MKIKKDIKFVFINLSKTNSVHNNWAILIQPSLKVIHKVLKHQKVFKYILFLFYSVLLLITKLNVAIAFNRACNISLIFNDNHVFY